MYIHEEDVHNTRAAELVIPVIYKYFQPGSVLDVGCGIGTWLYVFNKTQQAKVKGIDGDYVDKALLSKYLSAENFVAADLSKPFDLQQKFDLAMSLEVAEHLPEASAKNFVGSIVKHSDLVIFSAAIPEQIGQNHINEQWPSYWVDIFASYGYKAYDLIRPEIWNLKDVDVWYKQNILVYSKHPLPYPEASMPNVIHPELWDSKNKKIVSYQQQLERIKLGKVGLLFPLKNLFQSLLRFGKKSK